jgi:hypothetical protein
VGRLDARRGSVIGLEGAIVRDRQIQGDEFSVSETTETETEAPEAAVEAAVEAPEAEAAPVEEAAAEEAAEAEAVVEEIVEEGTPAEEYETEAAGPSGPRAREGLATLYLCERGHRTLAIWSEAPQTCHARPTRSGGECGRPVYHSTELPEQVQKALNPIKASKKSSKG